MKLDSEFKCVCAIFDAACSLRSKASPGERSIEFNLILKVFKSVSKSFVDYLYGGIFRVSRNSDYKMSDWLNWV